MKTLVSNSLEETRKIASGWLKQISARYADSNKAVIAGLSGHLGAGKTAFVKAVANELGVRKIVTSPTFVLMKIYETANSRWSSLVHIDAYRLEKKEELDALEWKKLAVEPQNLIMVEWPENAGLKEFPEGLDLRFNISDDYRKISIF